MARPLTYVPVPVQLRLKLAELRDRGMTFDRAWFCALRLDQDPLVTVETPLRERKDGICWPVDTDERAAWVKATKAMKEVWRRSYCGIVPTAGEAAAALLWGELDVSQPADRLEHLALEKVA